MKLQLVLIRRDEVVVRTTDTRDALRAAAAALLDRAARKSS